MVSGSGRLRACASARLDLIAALLMGGGMCVQRGGFITFLGRDDEPIDLYEIIRQRYEHGSTIITSMSWADV